MSENPQKPDPDYKALFGKLWRVLPFQVQHQFGGDETEAAEGVALGDEKAMKARIDFVLFGKRNWRPLTLAGVEAWYQALRQEVADKGTDI